MKLLVLLALTSAALAAPQGNQQQQGNKRFIGGIGGGFGGVPHGGIGGIHSGIGGVHGGVHGGFPGNVHGGFPGNVHGGIGGIGGVGVGGFPGGVGIGGIPGGIPQGNILGLPCKKFHRDPITGQYLCADSLDDALINQGISQNNGGLPHNAGGTGLFPG